jgi:hypothetical protein
MNFANVKLKEDQLIDPKLLPFVERIVLDNPNFVLVPHPSRLRDHCVMHQVEAPTGKKFVSMFGVEYTPTGERLGNIAVKRKYRGRGPDDCVFVVNSWRIDNRRGDSNTSETTKLTGALRIVKRALIPKAYTEVYEKMGDEITSNYNSAIRSLYAPIRNAHLLPQGGATVLQSYLFKHCNGYMIPIELQKVVTETFTSEKYHRAMEEVHLAERMEDYNRLGRLRLVIEHGPGYVFKDKEDNIQCLPFDELPEWLQNQISVLLLMKDHELVNDIGYRNLQGMYLVVSPE